MTRLSTVCNLFGALIIVFGSLAGIIAMTGTIATGVLIIVGSISLGLFWAVCAAALDSLATIAQTLKAVRKRD